MAKTKSAVRGAKSAAIRAFVDANGGWDKLENKDILADAGLVKLGVNSNLVGQLRLANNKAEGRVPTKEKKKGRGRGKSKSVSVTSAMAEFLRDRNFSLDQAQNALAELDSLQL